MAIANQFDATRFYVSSTEDYGLLPNNASYDPLPSMPWGRNWPQHVDGKGFVLVEDHRARTKEQFGNDLAQEATEWWLPEDTYGTPAREMKTAGPLPAGALTERPAKTASELLVEAKAAKTADIAASYDAAVAASLTMPTASPTAQDITIGAAAFASEDAEGFAFIMTTHAARRNELLAAVEAAETAEAVQAIAVSYAV